MTPNLETTDRTILWRRLDRPGHESARLFSEGTSWRLHGTAVFFQGAPCRLDYRIVCDSKWRTRATKVEGWVGNREVDIDIRVDRESTWWLNGEECQQAAGCIDIDLNFSPVTNLLPVRRVAMEIGGEARVRAAWLRFPSLLLEPLDQIYRRLDETTYRYESAGGEFVREIQMDDLGLVTDYPSFWTVEETASLQG